MIHCQGIGKPGPGVLLRTRLYNSTTPSFKLVRPVPCTVTISADAVPLGDNGILSTAYETPQQLLISWKSRKAIRDRLLRDVSNCNQAALAHALDDLHSELRQFSALARHLAAYHELREWRSVADEVTDGAEKYLRFLLADGKVYSRLDLALVRMLKEDSTTSMGTMDRDGSIQLIRALKNSIALQGNLHDMPNPVQLYCLEAEQPDQPLMRALQDQEQQLVAIIQQLATRGVPWSVPDAAYLHRLQQLTLARAAAQTAPQVRQPEGMSISQTPARHSSTAEPSSPQADAAACSSDPSSGPITVTMAPALAYRMLTSAEPDLRADGYLQGLLPRKDAMKSAQQRLAAVREQIAALNQQDSYAQLMMQSSLAASPAAVITFLQELAAAIQPAAEQELQGLQGMQQVLCAEQPMQPWDMEYLQAQVRGPT
jgi:Zn-dependent oligopeptidase